LNAKDIGRKYILQTLNKIKLFPTTTAIYNRVLNSPERIIIEHGGTGSGKTYGILQALIHIVCNSNRFPANGENDVITVTGQDLPNLKRDCIRQFLAILQKNELARTLLITPKKPTENNTHYKFATGWAVEFVSYETAQDAQAGKRRFLYVNEGKGVKYSIFEQLEMRTSDKLMIDYNPTGKFWAFQKYLNADLTPKAGVRFSVTTYKDNPFMPDAIRKEIESWEITDPPKFRVMGLGILGEVSGQIWKNYKGIEKLPDNFKRVAYGLDFGFTNDVTALVFVGLLNGELYMHELIYKNGLGLDDLEKELIRNGVKKQDKIIADSAELLAIDWFKKRGWNVTQSKKGAGSIVTGLSILNQYQKNITFDSVNIWSEIDGYVWVTDKSDGREKNVPIDKYNHITDATRYALQAFENAGRAVATV